MCIDGPAGAGKTTLAEQLIDALPAAVHASRPTPSTEVIHMDDLYEGWAGLEAAWPRLESWILAPLRAGLAGHYRRYDWALGAYAEWHEVPVPTALVVEGAGSADRAVDADASLRIWIEAPVEVRRARAFERDGDTFRRHWETWAAAERAHFARHGTRDRADLVIDGTVPLP